MDAYDWLGRWEPINAPGRHSSMQAALFAHGYQWRPVWAKKEPLYSMWERVGRAIPVEGTVDDGPPSWHRSPQARFWLQEDRQTLMDRFREWLKK